MVSCFKFLVVSVFLFSLVSVSVPWVSAVDGDVMSLEVAEAEEALILAYDSVLEAEEAGANVSALLNKLSLGGEYLAEAHVSVLLGNFANASRFAGLCVEVGTEVEDEAILLRDEAGRLEREDVLVRVFGSAVGVIIVVVSGFALWTIFKRRYNQRILGLKLEANDGES
jgi:hypothetical protein